MSVFTRADLVAEIGRRYGFYRKITATGGSVTTIISTSGLYETDDAHIGKFAYVLTDVGGASAAPEGQERPITDYVQSTATLTVDPAFTVAVANGDIIELLNVRRDSIENTINASIRTAGNAWLVLTTDDSTITIAEDDYDYTLPTDVVRLLGVYTRDATDDPWKRLVHWRVAKTPGAQELVFDNLDGMDAGHLIRLEYLARPSQPSTDTGTLGVGEPAEAEMVEYIIAQSLYLLHEQNASAEVNASGFRGHLTLAQYWREAAEAIKRAAVPMYPTGTAKSKRWPQTSRG